MSADGYTTLDRCLACGGSDLKPYLSLGEQPLANAFVPIPTQQTLVEWKDYPLGLQVCTACWHSQNTVAVDPHVLYDNYNYVSGTSASLRRYFVGFVDRVEWDFGKGPVSANDGFLLHDQVEERFRSLRILEIACNDGTLLKMFQDRGHVVFGVDPARNLSADWGFPGSNDFWNATTAQILSETAEPFDAIVAMNVLGHVADPLTFLTLCKQVLAPGGRIYVQTSQAHMIERGEFDTVYHEHLSFFTANSFAALAHRAELTMVDHQIVDVHGGSHLVTLQQERFDLESASCKRRQANEQEMVGRETAAGLYDLATYDAFQQRTRDTIDLVRQVLNTYRAGRRVVGYGAAAKSMTFVNALIAWVSRFPNMDRKPRPPIDYFVDDAPLKQNTLCPGSGIPVFAPDRLDGELGPILFVLTAWTMRDEIIEKIKARRPGKRDLFLTYFPTIELKG